MNGSQQLINYTGFDDSLFCPPGGFLTIGPLEINTIVLYRGKNNHIFIDVPFKKLSPQMQFWIKKTAKFLNCKISQNFVKIPLIRIKKYTLPPIEDKFHSFRIVVTSVDDIRKLIEANVIQCAMV